MNDDEMVPVFDYEIYDKAARRWRLALDVGTLEAIARLGGVPIRSSVLHVEAARLDDEGFLVKTRTLV